jgi:tripartite-type tricarboxylate transporter receptor subunit TctC
MHELSRRTLIGGIALMPGLAVSVGTASAQAWPSRPLRMIVPFAPGGSPDVIARLVGEGLSRELGQSVVIENRAGAGGNIAAEYVLSQPADGYTLFFGTSGNMATNKSLYRNLRFDPEVDFTPISLTYVSSNVLIVSPASGINSIADLVAEAKRRPGALSFGSPGVGTAGHLVGELFKHRTGIELTHVPYRGQSQVVSDLLAGTLTMSFEAVATAIPVVRAGQVRGLAITTRQRVPQLPEVPTFDEAGIGDFDMQAWAVLAVKTGTAPEILRTLNAAVVKVVDAPAVRDRINGMGVLARTSSLEDARRMLGEEVARWRTIVQIARIPPMD